MKKVIVDQAKCIGCNSCVLLNPETFELDQVSYKAKVKKQPAPSAGAITPALQSAVDSCPVGAISIVDE